MLNKRGENLYFFLTERCTKLQNLQAQLAQQVATGFESPEAHVRFLSDMLLVDTQLPTCLRLKATTFDSSTRFSDDMRLELTALDARMKLHIETIRTAPASLQAGLAKASLPFVLRLHQELTEYLEDPMLSGGEEHLSARLSVSA